MQLITSDNLSVIVGLGQTGLSCARYLHANGERFAVTDSREKPPMLAEFRAEFADVPITLGGFDKELCLSARRLVVNPGISLKEPVLLAAQDAGVHICGDIELFARAAKAPIVGITGSNGKSTVTTLLGEMAAKAGVNVAVGGNLGTPALDLLNDAVELYVVELSSFQLERCSQLGAEIAVVLNISEDHLDHHGSLLAYHQAKHRIFQGAKQALVNRDDGLTNPLVPEEVVRWRFGFAAPDFHTFGLIKEGDETWLAFESTKLLAVSSLKMAGKHNVANALAALALGSAVKLPMEAMLAALVEFRGLDHRCQFVGVKNGVRFYDDSKATNVGAAVAAMEGLATDGGEQKLVLVAGGQGKGGSYQDLIDSLVKYGRSAVFIGETAAEMDALLGGRIPSTICSTMVEAVSTAYSQSKSGDVILLAPACASFDMFNSYIDRGQQFQAAVAELLEGAA